MSKEKTTEEVRLEFLDHIHTLIDYWNGQDGNTKDKLEGLAFSIMVTLDGESALPPFIVAPIFDEADKQYCIANNEDYYPVNDESKIKGNIAGSLHELLFKEMKI